MRLTRIRNQLDMMGIKYQYTEENDCGSIDFDHKGLRYNIWEYPAPERGAESNVRSTGRQEDFSGDYEAEIVDILRRW
ncbi:MAG: kinase [Lachnospiraceae bacterium]|nr:kinase [Lachnospiraceae bacterium]